jgi:hypothetical protein
MALTQPLAVEPLRWGLRGVAAQCFVLGSFFNIITYRTQNKDFLRSYHFVWNPPTQKGFFFQKSVPLRHSITLKTLFHVK